MTNVVVVPHEGTWIEILTMARRLRNTPSFPTRERGLKCVLHIRYSISINVVPHEGTWIEMQVCLYSRLMYYVVPHEGTWIEILIAPSTVWLLVVVPHEGTWIEILFGTYLSVNLSVVPHEGTWIEITEGIIVNETQATSFPTRERGLK